MRGLHSPPHRLPGEIRPAAGAGAAAGAAGAPSCGQTSAGLFLVRTDSTLRTWARTARGGWRGTAVPPPRGPASRVPEGVSWTKTESGLGAGESRGRSGCGTDGLGEAAGVWQTGSRGARKTPGPEGACAGLGRVRRPRAGLCLRSGCRRDPHVLPSGHRAGRPGHSVPRGTRPPTGPPGPCSRLAARCLRSVFSVLVPDPPGSASSPERCGDRFGFVLHDVSRSDGRACSWTLRVLTGFRGPPRSAGSPGQGGAGLAGARVLQPSWTAAVSAHVRAAVGLPPLRRLSPLKMQQQRSASLTLSARGPGRSGCARSPPQPPEKGETHKTLQRKPPYRCQNYLQT